MRGSNFATSLDGRCPHVDCREAPDKGLWFAIYYICRLFDFDSSGKILPMQPGF